MSNIPEEVENDPSYRRSTLYAWSVKLKERDELVRWLNAELGEIGKLKYDRAKIDGLLEKIESMDYTLTSSSYNRVLDAATWQDRAAVGLRSLFTLRPAVAFEAVVSALFVLLSGLFVFFSHRSLTELVRMLLSAAAVSKAQAATSSVPVAEHIGPVQIYLVLGFATLIAASFIWFAATATLSREATVRRGSMEMVKQVLAFMIGVLTGFFASSH